MFKAITPKFINRIDAHLLVKHPVLWMSKIHYSLWYGMLLWFLSALIGLLVPINLKERIEYELWYFLFTVVGAVVLCFWVYNHVIFNKEKNYGYKKFTDEYKNFVLVFFSVAIFLMVPWPFTMVYDQRIDNMYSDEEVIKDINTINIGNPYMASSGDVYFSWTDSVSQEQRYNLRIVSKYGVAFFAPYTIRQDSVKFPELLTEYKLYILYKPTTDLNFLISRINTFKNTAAKYDVHILNNSKEIAKKYIDLSSRDYVYANEFYNNSPYNSDYYTLSTIFENVCRSKFTTLFIFHKDNLWVLFYFIFCISSFLLLFKMTYWQQYLITIVVLLLYPLIMFIFSELLPFKRAFRYEGFYLGTLLALLLFAIITLFITARERRFYRPFYNILNQVSYITLAFLPLLILFFLHYTTNIFHRWDIYPYYNYSVLAESNDPQVLYQNYLNNFYYEYWQEEFGRWVKISQYGGIALFVVLLPFFKELFIKQISLPGKT